MSTYSPEQSTDNNRRIGPVMENEEFFFNIPHSNETVSADNAPKGKLDRDRVTALVGEEGERIPQNASAIDIMTGRVDYTPLSEQRTETKPEKSKKGLVIGLSAGAAALTLAAVAVFGRGTSAEPTTPEQTPSASGSVAPGPSQSETGEPTLQNTPGASETSTPEATQPPLGAAERQNAEHEAASVTPEMLQPGFFDNFTADKVSPVSLNVYRGTNEKAGLFPNYEQRLLIHEAVLKDITAEDVVSYQDRVNTIFTQKYTKMINGEPVQDLTAAEMFSDNGYMTHFNQSELTSVFSIPEFNLKTPKAQANYLASTIATVDISNVRGATADAIRIERELEEYNNSRDENDKVPMNIFKDEPLPTLLAQNRFINIGDRDVLDNITHTINTASMNIATPLDGKAFIVKSHEEDIESADGKATYNKRAVTVLYENTAGEMTLKTLLMVPVKYQLVSDPTRSSGKILKETSNTFVFVNVAQTIE